MQVQILIFVIYGGRGVPGNRLAKDLERPEDC